MSTPTPAPTEAQQELVRRIRREGLTYPTFDEAARLVAASERAAVEKATVAIRGRDTETLRACEHWISEFNRAATEIDDLRAKLAEATARADKATEDISTAVKNWTDTSLRLSDTQDDLAAAREACGRWERVATMRGDVLTTVNRALNVMLNVGGWPYDLKPEDQIRLIAPAMAATASEGAPVHPDTARLDWLDQHEAAIEVNDDETLTCRVQASDDFKAHGYSDPYDIRAAIDAARAAQDATTEGGK